MPDFRDVDPRDLRVPPSRLQGADPMKLKRQIALFGRSAVGMPPPWVYEGTDGVLVLSMASNAPRESQSWRRANSPESR
jgi:hypothetical protein